MKREIKFRAWDNKNNQWLLNPDEIIFINQIVIPQGTGQFYVHNKDKYDIEIMQFTGLLDKNKKEIYEGDIVEMTDPYGENKAITEIKYINGAFTVEADGWFGMGECDVTSVGWAQEEDISMEVIGNIYENPELL